MATIKDIAREAGVSFTTVSNVIHGNTKRVSRETIEKIQTIMEEMHYVPNMGARMLVQNQSRIIGVIINLFHENAGGSFRSPFISEILGAIEQEIRENGYYMMLYATKSSRELTELTANWNVDGIITVGLGTEVCEKIRKKIRVPVVFTDCYFPDEKNYNVGTQDEEGACLATRHLIDMGHVRLGFVNETEIPEDGMERRIDGLRLKGFFRACRERGIPCGRESVLYSAGGTDDEKKIFFDRLWNRRDEFTGLVFSSDYFAAEAMDALKHKGMRIPEDMSVVGFDDIDMAKLVSPRLTTIHQGVSQKGILAVETLLAQIDGGKEGKKDTKLPVYLVQRESVCRPRDGNREKR